MKKYAGVTMTAEQDTVIRRLCKNIPEHKCDAEC